MSTLSDRQVTNARDGIRIHLYGSGLHPDLPREPTGPAMPEHDRDGRTMTSTTLDTALGNGSAPESPRLAPRSGQRPCHETNGARVPQGNSDWNSSVLQ